MTGKRGWSGTGSAAGNKRSGIMGALMVGLLVLLLPAAVLAAGDWTVDDGLSHPINENVIYNYEYIGSSAYGEVVQSAYTNTAIYTVYLGYSSTGRGSYQLSGSGSLLAGWEYIGNSGLGGFSQYGGTNHVILSLYMGREANSNGAYYLSGGSLSVGTHTGSAEYECIGYYGTGAFTQSGGSHQVTNDLIIGYFSGSRGAYDLSGSGSLSVGSDEYIGHSSTGAFTQSGGTHTVNQNLYIGRYSPSGTYYLSGGSLSVGNDEYLGYYGTTSHTGTGAFTQSGGTHAVGGSLTLANASGGSGTYTLSGGSLRAGTVYLNPRDTFTQTGGTFDFSTFNQSGGTANLTEMVLGRSDGGSGAYAQSGGSLYVGVGGSGNHEYIGNYGTGVFTQSGGSHQVANNIYIGRNDSSSGAYAQSGGTTSVDKYLVVGRFAGSRGAYDLSGGSLSVGGGGADYDEYIGYTGTGAFTQSSGTHRVANDLYLGLNPDGRGAYTLSGSGSLWVGVDEYIGNSGIGAFTQSGGTHNVTGYLYLGSNSGSRGTYDLSGSGSLVANKEYIGNAGSGDFTQSGGTHTVTNTLTLAPSAGGRSTYNLYNGRLAAGTIEVKDGGAFTQIGGNLDFATFNQSGGSVTLPALNVATGGSSTYNLSGSGILSAGNVTIGKSAPGTFIQTGGSHTIEGNLILANNSGSLGTYELHNGSLTAANELIGFGSAGFFTQSGGINKVHNLVISAGLASGAYNLAGGTLETANVQVNRGGSFNLTGGTQTVTGTVTAVGAIHTTDTDVTWKGAFTLTEGGEYRSDPSTQTFDNLIVEAQGCIMADQYTQDTYIIRNNFQNQSTRNTEWRTEKAVLKFVGDTVHDLYINGADRGANPAGAVDNFAWETLNIAGQIVHLYDGNLDTPGGALYIGLLSGLDVNKTNLVINNIFGQDAYVLNIYYDPLKSPDLHQDTYTFADGKGSLMPTPLPASLLLLGSGLLGLGLLGGRRPNG